MCLDWQQLFVSPTVPLIACNLHTPCITQHNQCLWIFICFASQFVFLCFVSFCSHFHLNPVVHTTHIHTFSLFCMHLFGAIFIFTFRCLVLALTCGPEQAPAMLPQTDLYSRELLMLILSRTYTICIFFARKPVDGGICIKLKRC